MTTSTMPSHPLDPLSSAEVQRACDLIRQESGLGEHLRIAQLLLHEPDKKDVLSYQPGQPFNRQAFGVILDKRSGDTYEAIADLAGGRVSLTRMNEAESEFGQACILMEEFAEAERIVKADPGWRAAMQKRGLNDAEMELVQVDPFSAGYFDLEHERGKRIVHAVCYYREELTDNGYARPIEGVVAHVDLIAGKVAHLVDERVVPIPKKKRNYHGEALGTPRSDLKELNIVQPDGPSFEVNGWEVKWQKWSFRVGFTPREGLVLHQLSYDDDGQERPIIYRASVTEMVVPYADPTANHYWKSAFDGGEYGLGKCANQLELGCDCLGLIHYFDIPAADDFGQAYDMKNAVCMHEEDYGTLWKHNEFRSGIHELRRSRRLVISFFATVGNYDYGFYWYLYQDGTIQLEAKLTGIIQTAAVTPGEPYPWGGMVDEGLAGPTHQHFFNARLHMMVDGEQNSVTETEFHPTPMGPKNPYGNVFETRSRTLKTELDTTGIAEGRVGTYWKIINPNVKNSVGNPTGYKLVVNPSPLMLAHPEATVQARGGFATRHVWVTPYTPAEKFASGDYPNQHPGGDGLPKYTASNRPIENTDLVVWHTFGHTHVCKPEDFPIMPVEYAGFLLKPNGFFRANAAMDLPKNTDQHSVQDGTGTHCCGGDKKN